MPGSMSSRSRIRPTCRLLEWRPSPVQCVFACKDGHQVLISVQSDREWVKLADLFLGKPELARDARFATNVARVANRAETDAEVAAGFASLTLTEATEAILSADVAFATVNDMEGLSRHPHLRRITVETPNGPVSYPAPAPIFADEPRSYGAVPALRLGEK